LQETKRANLKASSKERTDGQAYSAVSIYAVALAEHRQCQRQSNRQ